MEIYDWFASFEWGNSGNVGWDDSWTTMASDGSADGASSLFSFDSTSACDLSSN